MLLHTKGLPMYNTNQCEYKPGVLVKLRPIVVIVPHPTLTQSTLVSCKQKAFFAFQPEKQSRGFRILNTPPNPNQTV